MSSCYRLPKTFQRNLSGLFESFPCTIFPVLVLIGTPFTVQRTAESKCRSMGTEKKQNKPTMFSNINHEENATVARQRNLSFYKNWKCLFGKLGCCIFEELGKREQLK